MPTSSTISGNVYATVDLGGAQYANAVTIETSGQVRPSGLAGANGVYGDSAGLSLINEGVVTLAYGVAGSGGIGVYFTAAATGATIVNSGRIYGGSPGGSAATGGAGVEMNGGGTITNYLDIAGGSLYPGTGGPGVTGGVGVSMVGGTLNNFDSIGGGSAYAGATGVSMSGGILNNGVTFKAGLSAFIGGGEGGTGAGGAGAILNGTSATNGAYGLIYGGSAIAGAAGAGVRLLAGATLTNTGKLDGGSSATGVGGAGVSVAATTTLHNDAGGLITGSGYGGSTGGIGGDGVDLAAGGTLTNAGTIVGSNTTYGTAGEGVLVSGTASLTTSGTIEGGATQTTTGGIGVDLSVGGTLNVTAGNIYGGAGQLGNGGAAVYASGAGGASATVTVTGGALTGGSSLDGQAGLGVDLGGAASLVNAAKIVGGESYGSNGSLNQGGFGVEMYGAGSYALNQASGLIQGGVGKFSADGGAGVFTFGQGAKFVNAGTIDGGNAYGTSSIQSGAGAVVGLGTKLYNYGSITGGAGLDGSLSNVGVWVDGGTVYDHGTITAGVPTGGAVFFGTPSGDLVLDPGGTLQGGIEAFQVGDKLDFLGTGYTTQGSASNGTFTVATPSNGNLSFVGSYADEQFVFTAIDAGTMTEITLEASCYLKGTRIAGEHGEARIETLAIGDRVLTHSGELRVIRWIGRRHYSKYLIAAHRAVWPVRIKSGALAENTPRRDLWVSPEHAMWIDGMLIPAQALINGESIVQEEWVEPLDYLHLEFDTHDVVCADGAWSESFVDDDSRQNFDNAAEYWLRYPHARLEHARFCAPRVEDGAALEAVRRRLAARANIIDAQGTRTNRPPDTAVAAALR